MAFFLWGFLALSFFSLLPLSSCMHHPIFPITHPHLLYHHNLPHQPSPSHTSHLHNLLVDSVPPHRDNSFLLRDAGAHLHTLLLDNAPQDEHSFLLDDGTTAPAPHLPSPSRLDMSLLLDNARQDENSFLLDDGSTTHSPQLPAPASRLDKHLLRDSVPQEDYSFLRSNGGEKGMPGSYRRFADKAPVRGGSSKLAAEAKDYSNVVLLDEVSQEEKNSLLEDGGQLKLNKDAIKASVADQEGGSILGDNVDQGEYAFLLDDGVKHGKHASPISSSDHEANPTDGKLKMAVGDSPNNMVQQGDERPGTQDRSISGGSGGRSRTCTSNPDVCHQLAQAEEMQFIALYGQLLQPSQVPTKRPACCAGACVDLAVHRSHCGICNNVCGIMQTCCDGKCVDLNIDPLNCGRCGHSCPSLIPCEFGMCGYY